MKDLLLLSLGLILLLLGSRWLVSSLKNISIYFKLKPLFLSIVVIGFVSSSPECFVTLNAVFKDLPTAAIGNIIGSNIINILLVLSLSSLFFGLSKNKHIIRFDMPFLVSSAILLGLAVLNKSLEWWDGLILLSVFSAYLFLLFKNRKSEEEEPISLDSNFSPSKALLLLITGFLLLFAGSSLAVDSSIELVKALSLSEKFAGVFILSLSTSLPELAACLQAGIKKEKEMVLGSVIGSNLFNTLFVLGSACLIKSMSFAGLYGDYFFMSLVYSLLFLSLLAFKKAPKWIFILFILSYTIYIFLISKS